VLLSPRAWQHRVVSYPSSKPTNVFAANTTKALAEHLADLYAEGTPWLPCGLGTRLDWGAPVQSPSQAVSVSGLKRIIDHAIDELTVTVEAGLPLAELQKALAEKKQWLALDWPWGSQPNSDSNIAGSVGGLVARGLAGGLRHRHLGVRDQLIGIGLLRSDGVAAHAGGRVVKNVAGFDLMRLLCGSWGSLAMITELTLRTQPIRPAHARFNVEGKIANLEAWRAELMRSSFTLEFCDWLDLEPDHWQLQIGLASVSDQAVNDQLNSIQSLATQYQLQSKRQPWQGPFPEQTLPEASLETPHWLVRIGLPPAQIHKLLSSKELVDLSDWHWRIAAGSGIGDGWQTYSADQTKSSNNEQLSALRNHAHQLGGYLTLLRQPNNSGDRLPAWLDAPSRPLIEAVKQQFDPKRQVAIGRLPGVSG